MRSAVIMVALVACGGVEPETLFAPGEHEVGFTTIEVTYDSPGAEEARTISVEVWYPADPGDAQRATYSVAGIVSVVSDNAYDAPPPLLEGVAPLALYSHGSGGQGLLGYPYGEHLASHGWVVVAPNHLGNTAGDVVNGSTTPFIRITVDRPLDVQAVLDQAEQGLVDGLEVDASRTMVIGHSFGGYTTLAVGGMRLDVDSYVADCQGDPDVDPSCAVLAQPEVDAALRAGFTDSRVAALVPQAPALVSVALPDSLSAIDVPMLLQSGERDQSTTHEAQAVPLWQGTDGEQDVWVNLPDGGHYSFVTICDDLTDAILGLFLEDAQGDGCDDTFIPPADALPRLNATLHAFGNAHVLDEGGWDKELTSGGQEVWGAGLEIQGR